VPRRNTAYARLGHGVPGRRGWPTTSREPNSGAPVRCLKARRVCRARVRPSGAFTPTPRSTDDETGNVANLASRSAGLSTRRRRLGRRPKAEPPAPSGPSMRYTNANFCRPFTSGIWPARAGEVHERHTDSSNGSARCPPARMNGRPDRPVWMSTAEQRCSRRTRFSRSPAATRGKPERSAPKAAKLPRRLLQVSRGPSGSRFGVQLIASIGCTHPE